MQPDYAIILGLPLLHEFPDSLLWHKGRIRNFEISKEEKIKELEQKRFVSAGFNLIAGGVVKIKGK